MCFAMRSHIHACGRVAVGVHMLCRPMPGQLCASAWERAGVARRQQHLGPLTDAHIAAIASFLSQACAAFSPAVIRPRDLEVCVPPLPMAPTPTLIGAALTPLGSGSQLLPWSSEGPHPRCREFFSFLIGGGVGPSRVGTRVVFLCFRCKAPKKFWIQN